KRDWSSDVCSSDLPSQRGVARDPRVFRGGVQARPGEVQAHGSAVVGERLRLESGEQAQGLRVALETTDTYRREIEGRFTVVAERWMPQIVRETGGVDNVGIAAQTLAELAADLSDFE